MGGHLQQVLGEDDGIRGRGIAMRFLVHNLGKGVELVAHVDVITRSGERRDVKKKLQAGVQQDVRDQPPLCFGA